MGDLISSDQIASVKAVLQTVTDQFFVIPVSLLHAGDNANRFSEDLEAPVFSRVELSAQVDFGKGADSTEESETGSLDIGKIKASFNFADLVTEGLNIGNTVGISKLQDLLIVNGEQYDIEDVAYDGFLDVTPILVVLTCTKRRKKV